MIPKVIHCCWFGGNPKPEFVLKCIERWKKYCPDYKIVEWNESSFGVGAYLDTDVELKRSLDDLLRYDAWFAQDDIRWINTGLGFGAEAGSELIERIVRRRESRPFDLTACHVIDMPIIAQCIGFKQNKTSQEYISLV